VALLVILVAGVGLNLFNARMGLASGRGSTYVLGAAPFLLLAGLVWMLKKKGRRHTAFTLIPVAAVLVLCEIGFRMYYVFAPGPRRALLASPVTRNLGSESIYKPHHYAVYNLNPNVRLAEGTRHNGLGLRDHRELTGPDDQAVRIVFLGGSTTYTIGIRDNTRIFSCGLEEKLNAAYKAVLGDRRIEVINAGMGGATSAENLIRLIFFISQARPDLLVIHHGINDVLPRAQGTIRSDYGNYRTRWTSPGVFASKDSLAACLTRRLCEHSMLLNYALLTLRVYRPRKVSDYTVDGSVDSDDPRAVHTNGPEYFERNTRYMIALAREMGAEVMLATAAITPRAGEDRRVCVPQHNAILAKIAAEKKVRFYDFAAEMPKDAEHMPDGRHVSQVGSDRKRDLFFRHFVREGVIPALLADADRPKP